MKNGNCNFSVANTEEDDGVHMYIMDGDGQLTLKLSRGEAKTLRTLLKIVLRSDLVVEFPVGYQMDYESDL